MTDAPRFVPGDVVDDRYRIVALLGRGGMGEVYRADDLRLEQTVALKFLPTEMLGEDSYLERFLEEVRVARRVSHPNVCRVHDVGEIAGQTYLSMEYVDGEDLASLLRRIGRLPHDKAVEIAHQLCAGIAAAHEQGVLHRDLKPANVMVDGEGRVRVADFGLAAVAERLGADHARVGTPKYMAPEQLAGREVSTRSDLFSLGLVLFELFTGRPAFEAKTLDELIRAQESGAPSPSRHLPDIDPAVEKVIQRCLDSDPERRPRSAREVAAGLPGGDPLAAAIAAGETPSPELIAAAGGRGALPPWAAWGGLAAVVALLVFLTLADRRVQLLSVVDPAMSPPVLEHRAREIARALGFSEEPADEAGDFTLRIQRDLWDADADEPWHRLAEPWSESIRYWWRSAPGAMVPRSDSGRVGWLDPALDVPGMANLILAFDGRLLALRAMPSTESLAGDIAYDWEPAFAAAGLDLAAFEEIEPEFLPWHFATERRSWRGTDPSLPDATFRVNAASSGSVPVHWSVRTEWGLPEIPRPARSERVELAYSISRSFVEILALVGGAWWGIRNLLQRKGDRRTATRVGVFVLAISALEWLLGAHHVPSFSTELGRVMEGSARWLWLGAFTWILYVALEPTVRATWPQKLVSWTRLVGGRVTDPAVGRDVLLGVIGGLAVQGVMRAHWLVAAALGDPSATPHGFNRTSYLGVLDHLGRLAGLVALSGFWALLILFLYVFFLRLLRRRALAVVAVLAIGLARMPHSVVSSMPALDIGMRLVALAIILALVFRGGLLSLAALFLMLEGAGYVAFVIEPAKWYAGPGQLMALIAVSLALFGAVTSTRAAAEGLGLNGVSR